MIYIKIEENERFIFLDCNKNNKNGEPFKVVIDKNTRRVLEATTDSDMDISTVYSCVCSYLEKDKPLPQETCAAWG